MDEIARLIVSEGRSQGSVARDYDLHESTVKRWADRARARLEAVKSGASDLSTAERNELEALRKRVARLEMEKDILRKATAFFAKDHI
jgi:transposase